MTNYVTLFLSSTDSTQLYAYQAIPIIRTQHTKLPLIKVSNHFLHKMPVLINFSDIFSWQLKDWLEFGWSHPRNYFNATKWTSHDGIMRLIWVFSGCKQHCVYLIIHWLISLCDQTKPSCKLQNIGPDLDPNCIKLVIVFLKYFFEILNFEKITRRQQSTKNSMQIVKSKR